MDKLSHKLLIAIVSSLLGGAFIIYAAFIQRDSGEGISIISNGNNANSQVSVINNSVKLNGGGVAIGSNSNIILNSSIVNSSSSQKLSEDLQKINYKNKKQLLLQRAELEKTLAIQAFEIEKNNKVFEANLEQQIKELDRNLSTMFDEK